ncbi:PAS-domain containing protein [Yoonia sp.]|uniref:PAS-domain containing protein n=1 Tax=Yoonia sp. TaxID=2212373 RepID=UPI0025E01963|nr:PAS-domain containing protein [Yoonia sp.]
MPHRIGTDHLTRAGLNLIQQALTIYDADLRLAVCNRPFRQMFGLPQWLVTPGASFADTIRYLVETGEYGHVDDPEGFVRDRLEAARAFVPHYMERTRANGRVISVEGSPLAEGGWVTVYTDITAIKQQETLLRARSEELSDQLLTHAERLAQTNRALEATVGQLEEAKRELTEAEARIRLTTEMAPAHIAHVDRDGVYTYTNRRLSAVLPGRPSDIVGLGFAEALGVPTATRLRPYLDGAMVGEASVLEFTDTASGRRIRTAFTPDQAEPNAPINGVYLLSTDVTEEAQARAALAQTHKRELAAQLTSGLAHDFANLLTIILGLQGRLEKMPLPVAAQELTGATKAAARRGGVLLDKIARMSGPQELHPVPTDLVEFLGNFTPLARAPLPDGILLQIDNQAEANLVMLDAGSLQDSLLNLVLNARDAIGATGKIALSVREVQGTWLEFVVTDTGPGFSDAALHAALDPFFTTKGDGGSGLGLSMVYDQTKLLGGQVLLANDPTGARVALRLPLKLAVANTRPLLILLVDDTADIRTNVREMLTDLGHQVIEAETADEALTLAELPDLDWILSDIRLAGETSGVDLLNNIAVHHTHLRLALMTSLPLTDDLRQAGAAHWPVLSKPLDLGGLHHLLTSEVAA